MWQKGRGKGHRDNVLSHFIAQTDADNSAWFQMLLHTITVQKPNTDKNCAERPFV